MPDAFLVLAGAAVGPAAPEHLHDEDAGLLVDETGDVKKGTHTVGVRRQYTGTAGRIENAHVAVYLVYAGRRGHAAVDRILGIRWRTVFFSGQTRRAT